MTIPIVFAGDNAVMVTMLAVLLKQSGYQVHRAENRSMTQAILKQVKADLLIVDLAQSDGETYELCNWVRGNPRFSQLPIITLIGPHESPEPSLKAGANRCIS